MEAVIGADFSPWALAYDPPDRYLYCANNAPGTVTVVDCSQDSVIATVGVNASPAALLFNSVNRKVYCANSGYSTVSVIDCASNTVVATLDANYGPIALCWDSLNNRVFVADNEGSNLAVIRDTAPAAVHEPWPVGPGRFPTIPGIVRSTRHTAFSGERGGRTT